jgi:hypothetical protein
MREKTSDMACLALPRLGAKADACAAPMAEKTSTKNTLRTCVRPPHLSCRRQAAVKAARGAGPGGVQCRVGRDLVLRDHAGGYPLARDHEGDKVHEEHLALPEPEPEPGVVGSQQRRPAHLRYVRREQHEKLLVPPGAFSGRAVGRLGGRAGGVPCLPC